MSMQYPIRVLHIVVNMNRGGAETLIMNLYRNIDREKIQFDFLVHKSTGDYEEEISALGGRIYRIPYITDVGHFGYIRELNNFFRKYSYYKIVHAHMDCMSGLAIQAAKRYGIPIRISHSHNTQSEGNILAKLYKGYIKTKITPNATDLLACSEASADWLFGRKAANALTIKNGVEALKFTYNEAIRQEKRKELGIGKDVFVIGNIGRFYPQKNHDFLIDIFLELKKYKMNSLLLLVGDGPLKISIEKKTKDVNLENSVVFLGVRSDIPDLLMAMDVLVFPSHHEGLPVTIIEAQAAGLKCVVSEAVPRQSDIGADLMTYLSLKAQKKNWTDEILKPYKREHKLESRLKKSGYDVTYTSKQIQELYINTIDRLA
jgi:glycosyltransferase involved in cell wall biosynthesis